MTTRTGLMMVALLTTLATTAHAEGTRSGSGEVFVSESVVAGNGEAGACFVFDGANLIPGCGLDANWEVHFGTEDSATALGGFRSEATDKIAGCGLDANWEIHPGSAGEIEEPTTASDEVTSTTMLATAATPNRP